jgi:hypothetical protein
MIAEPFAVTLALLCAGLFLLSGLVTGVLKYAGMRNSPEARAPLYIDIAHRSALLYSFAALVLAALLDQSPLPPPAQITAVGVPLFLFALTIARYVQLGLAGVTRTQFTERTWLTGGGMLILIAGEIGGTLVVIWGFVVSRFFS